MTDMDFRQRFRDAMANLPAAVNIITSDGARGRCGITASAVCSVTDSPPTMLVCINQSSYVHDLIRDNGRACINVLDAADQHLARTFAGATGCDMGTRFASGDWRPGELALPVLPAAIVSLEGRLVDSKLVGSHSVMFVHIEHIRMRDDGEGLIYFGRRFRRLERQEAC
ncbi:flavin reductase [Burkholderia gladioli]|uniref:flavin reductase n=1 Tax=Burkholderia gladioli TaxID=28095 RepID=UPI001640FCA1|nr:flavin reductase [Burkholderia gladioli]